MLLEPLTWMISNLPSSSNLLWFHSPPLLLSSLNVQISTRLRVRGFTTEQAAPRTNLYFKALHANSGQPNTTISRANQRDFQLFTQVLKQPLVVDVCVYDVCLWFLQPASLPDFCTSAGCVLFNQSHLVACTEKVRWCSLRGRIAE